MSITTIEFVWYGSAANNQENDAAVKVLMKISETKNKNEKKITETEIETKTRRAF